MPEIRQDITTEEWVIMNEERAKRPHDFVSSKDKKEEPLAHFSESCPFCPGNEARTPEEVFSLWNKKTGKWQVRVFENRYPALFPRGNIGRRKEGELFVSMDGLGVHEVVVETPLHNKVMARMEDYEVEEVIRAYKERYTSLINLPFVHFVLIFKNHGATAGTSLEHPHSQIIATPLVPRSVRMKCEVATHYHDDTGRCLYLDIINEEVSIAKRVILQTDNFVTLHPFASHSPFETWIMPKRNEASFGNITDEEISELATVLRKTLFQLYKGLNNPDFNFIINSVPKGDEENGYYLWHLQVIPRLTNRAGFEIGSGIHINTVIPEETASFLRTLKDQSVQNIG